MCAAHRYRQRLNNTRLRLRQSAGVPHAAINSRFERGKPHTVLAHAGVVLYALTQKELHHAEMSSKPSWVANMMHVSATLVNARLPFPFGVFGYVAAPDSAQQALRCSYTFDASTERIKCSDNRAGCIEGCFDGRPGTRDWCGEPGAVLVTPGSDLRQRVHSTHNLNSDEARAAGAPGCGWPWGTPQQWELASCIQQLSCAWRPSDLDSMLASHEFRISRLPRPLCAPTSWPRCVLYNELVLSTATWNKHLPQSVEAMWYKSIDGEFGAFVRQMVLAEHGRFRATFNLSCDQVPLVRLDSKVRSSNATQSHFAIVDDGACAG